MSSLRVMDMLKLTFKLRTNVRSFQTKRVLEFKYEQNKLTTSIFSTVNTDKGAIKGVKRLTIWGDAYFSFEKIPYAKPPLGKLRFKAPLPADKWDGVLNCTGPADKPLQSNVFFRRWKGSEDCLYLNVFTKNLTPTKLRPVMVWIFGGGFQIGEATRDMFSPDFFMSKDIVLVTIAYRLGPFGFLSMNDPSADVPGNAGIKDQILSLRWVQANIAAFGGDPENVTLFGESAGGASTHLCMLSEQSKGLFHKAIIMSGSALCPWARPPNNDFPYRFAKRLGYMGKQNDVEVLEFLQAVSGPDLVKMSGTILSKEEKHNRILFAFGPVVEPYVTDQCILSEDPRIVMQTTWSNQIPLMLGGTSFEGLLFHPEVTRRPATLEEVGDCKNLLPLDIGKGVDDAVLEEYAATLKHTYFGDKECNMQTLMKFLDLESYREFWHPMYRIARSRLQVNAAPTYLYRFDYDSRDGNAIRNILVGRNSTGACHGDDLCYIFFAMFSHRPAQNSSEYKITRTMIGLWTSFAESGDPNCDMLEELIFEPLASDEPMKCLNISDKLEFMELPELKKLKVWDSFYAQGKL